MIEGSDTRLTRETLWFSRHHIGCCSQLLKFFYFPYYLLVVCWTDYPDRSGLTHPAYVMAVKDWRRVYLQSSYIRYNRVEPISVKVSATLSPLLLRVAVFTPAAYRGTYMEGRPFGDIKCEVRIMNVTTSLYCRLLSCIRIKGTAAFRLSQPPLPLLLRPSV